MLWHGLVLCAFWDAETVRSSWLRYKTVGLLRTGLVSGVLHGQDGASQSTIYE